VRLATISGRLIDCLNGLTSFDAVILVEDLYLSPGLFFTDSIKLPAKIYTALDIHRRYISL
jgi:hypothetical protein